MLLNGINLKEWCLKRQIDYSEANEIYTRLKRSDVTDNLIAREIVLECNSIINSLLHQAAVEAVKARKQALTIQALHDARTKFFEKVGISTRTENVWYKIVSDNYEYKKLKENWRLIEGTADYYISDLARVKRKINDRYKLIRLKSKQYYNKQILVVKINNQHLRVHELVAKHFLNYKPYFKVYAKNGNLTDARLENLYYKIPNSIYKMVIGGNYESNNISRKKSKRVKVETFNIIVG